jgi:hypothetical protein
MSMIAAVALPHISARVSKRLSAFWSVGLKMTATAQAAATDP